MNHKKKQNLRHPLPTFGSFSFFQASLWLGVNKVIQKLTKSLKGEFRHAYQCCILIPRKCLHSTPFPHTGSPPCQPYSVGPEKYTVKGSSLNVLGYPNFPNIRVFQICHSKNQNNGKGHVSFKNHLLPHRIASIAWIATEIFFVAIHILKVRCRDCSQCFYFHKFECVLGMFNWSCIK